MKPLFLLPLLLAVCNPAPAQTFGTKTGRVSFFSAAPMEDIEAANSAVQGTYSAATGELAFSMLVSGFRFEKKLMQQHFNENYMESDVHPYATYTGRVAAPSAVNVSVDGAYAVEVVGTLTIHGVAKEVRAPGVLVVKAGTVAASARFPLRIADYGVKVPKMMFSKIAEVVEVTVSVPMARTPATAQP